MNENESENLTLEEINEINYYRDEIRILLNICKEHPMTMTGIVIMSNVMSVLCEQMTQSYAVQWLSEIVENNIKEIKSSQA